MSSLIITACCRFREAAAKALSNLAGDDADRRFIASKGALHALVALLNPLRYKRSKTNKKELEEEEDEDECLWEVSSEVSSCLNAAALALRNLASSDKNAEVICEKTQAVEYLITLLGARLLSTDSTRGHNSDTDSDMEGEGDKDWERKWEVAEAAACALGGVAHCSEVKLAIAYASTSSGSGAVLQLGRLVREGCDR